jgi:hypothetical protein
MTCFNTDRLLTPQSKDERLHPERVTLECLMRGSLPRTDAQVVVRCLAVAPARKESIVAFIEPALAPWHCVY